MAKQGLNISADNVIVASAGALAKAQNPFDMTDMYTGLVESHGALMDDISDKAKQYVSNIKAINQPVKDAFAELDKQIQDGTVENQEERDAMQAVLDGFRGELRNIPLGKKGQKQRDDLLYKVNKYVKSHQADAADTTAFIKLIQDEKLYSAVLTEQNHKGFNELSRNIANHSLKRETAENFSVTKNDQGVNVYKLTDPENGETLIEGTMSDLNGMIAKTDYEGLTKFEGVTGKVYENVKDNNLKTWNQVETALRDDYREILSSNPGVYSTIIMQNVKGENVSFYDAINDPKSATGQKVLMALNEIRIGKGAASLDKNTDGVIDEKEVSMVTGENYNVLVNSIINPTPGNAELAHNLLTEFYIDTEAKKAFDEGNSHRTYPKVDDDDSTEVNNPTVANNVSRIKDDGKTSTFTVYYNDLAPKAKGFKLLEMGGKPLLGFSGEIYTKEGDNYYVSSRIRVSKQAGGVTKSGAEMQPKNLVPGGRDEVLHNLFLTSYLDDFDISYSSVETPQSSGVNLPSSFNVGLNPTGFNQPRVKLFSSSFDTRRK